jgi:Spy/CpxP family protein refolding chaperone
MKQMKSNLWKVVLGSAMVAAMALTYVGTSVAQTSEPAPQGPPPGHGRWGGPGGFERPERELRMLTNRLSLTTEQQASVKAVLEQQITQMTALREKSDPAANETPEARETRRTQMLQIRQDTDTKITALLDENQKKQYAELLAERKARMERRQGPGAPPVAGEQPQ